MSWQAVGNFFKAIGRWFVGAATHVADITQQIATYALPIVEEIAALTPTRADDELIALFKKYALVWSQEWLALPLEKRGAALLDAATQIIAKRFPGVAASVLQLAIQMALVQFKANSGSSEVDLLGGMAGQPSSIAVDNQ